MFCSWTFYVTWGRLQWRLCCPCSPSGEPASTNIQQLLELLHLPNHRFFGLTVRRLHSSCATAVCACEQHHIPPRLTLHPRGHHWQELDIHHLLHGQQLWPQGQGLYMASGTCPLHIDQQYVIWQSIKITSSFTITVIICLSLYLMLGKINSQKSSWLMVTFSSTCLSGCSQV